MSDYDQRQYHLMLDRVDAFSGDKISLEKLIADLEGLVAALEHPSARWKQSFLHFWGALETNRAVTLDRGLKEFEADAVARTRDAVGQLRLLILKQVHDSRDA